MAALETQLADARQQLQEVNATAEELRGFEAEAKRSAERISKLAEELREAKLQVEALCCHQLLSQPHMRFALYCESSCKNRGPCWSAMACDQRWGDDLMLLLLGLLLAW